MRVFFLNNVKEILDHLDKMRYEQNYHPDGIPERLSFRDDGLESDNYYFDKESYNQIKEIIKTGTQSGSW